MDTSPDDVPNTGTSKKGDTAGGSSDTPKNEAGSAGANGGAPPASTSSATPPTTATATANASASSSTQSNTKSGAPALAPTHSQVGQSLQSSTGALDEERAGRVLNIAERLQHAMHERPNDDIVLDARLRALEVEAYTAILSCFRAQGELTWHKEQLLNDLRVVLKISDVRHQMELLRAVKDPELIRIAKHNETVVHMRQAHRPSSTRRRVSNGVRYSVYWDESSDDSSSAGEDSGTESDDGKPTKRRRKTKRPSASHRVVHERSGVSDVWPDFVGTDDSARLPALSAVPLPATVDGNPASVVEVPSVAGASALSVREQALKKSTSKRKRAPPKKSRKRQSESAPAKDGTPKPTPPPATQQQQQQHQQAGEKASTTKGQNGSGEGGGTEKTPSES